VDVLLLKINLGDDIATKLGKMAFGKQQESVTGVENTAGDLLSDDRVGEEAVKYCTRQQVTDSSVDEDMKLKAEEVLTGKCRDEYMF